MSPLLFLEGGTACAECLDSIDPGADAVALGDLFFHRPCVPHCQHCGSAFRPELETAWSYREQVLSAAYGYERLPYDHACADCGDAALRDEPSAQD